MRVLEGADLRELRETLLNVNALFLRLGLGSSLKLLETRLELILLGNLLKDTRKVGALLGGNLCSRRVRRCCAVTDGEDAVGGASHAQALYRSSSADV